MRWKILLFGLMSIMMVEVVSASNYSQSYNATSLNGFTLMNGTNGTAGAVLPYPYDSGWKLLQEVTATVYTNISSISNGFNSSFLSGATNTEVLVRANITLKQNLSMIESINFTVSGASRSGTPATEFCAPFVANVTSLVWNSIGTNWTTGGLLVNNTKSYVSGLNDLINSTNNVVGIAIMCKEMDSGEGLNVNYIGIVVTYNHIPLTTAFNSSTESNNSILTTRNNTFINVSSGGTNYVNTTIRLYNSAFTLINSTNSSINLLSLNVTNLANGDYYFNATAFNTTGFSVNTATYKVTINITTPSDSCTYSGSGNWDINCADACNISTNYNLSDNNILFSGSGIVNLFGNLTGWTKLSVSNSCRMNIYSSGGIFG